MARVNFDNSDKIFQLLRRYKLIMKDDIPNEYKCVICRDILINACQASCGCNFCQQCIDEAVQDGDNFCPGDNEECKLSNLSVALRDYRMNRQISKLIVECPLENCSHKCQLMNLYAHLESCEKRSLECPFQSLGCPDVTSNGQIDLDKHLANSIEKHSKIVVDSIENWRMRIDKLETELARKQSKMDQMATEMRTIKLEQQELLNEMETLKPTVENKINEISAELTNRVRDDRIDRILVEIDLMKAEAQNMKRRIEVNKYDVDEKFKLEMNGKLKALQAELEGQSEMRMSKLCEKEKLNQLDFEKRLSEVEKNLNLIDGIFMWKINKIEQIKQCGYIWSEYFYSSVNSYRQRLRLDAYGDHLWLRFCVYSSPADLDLDWPFQAEITLKVASKLWPDSGKAITKQCTIDKPIFGSCECSEEFKFSYSDFISNGLTLNDIFFVECHIRQ